MIKREYYVVKNNLDGEILTIEARCDSLENAQLFCNENKVSEYEFNKGISYKINEVVVIKGD